MRVRVRVQLRLVLNPLRTQCSWSQAALRPRLDRRCSMDPEPRREHGLRGAERGRKGGYQSRTEKKHNA